MNQQEFYQNMAKLVEELLGKEYHVMLFQIQKIGEEKLDAFLIKKEKQDNMPIFYLKDYYKRWKQGEEMKVLAEDIVVEYFQKDSYQKSIRGELDFLHKKDNIEQAIFFHCISTEKISSNIPCRKVFNLSLVYSILISCNKQTIAFLMITEDIKKYYSWTEEELFQLSKKNTCRLFPERIQSMAEIFAKELPDIIQEMKEDEVGITVISNHFNFYGFSVIFYSGVLARLAEKKGGNLMVIPSSVHEALVLVDKGRIDTRGMNSTIRFVNGTQVLKEDQLSDCAYYYDREDKALYLMEDYKKGEKSVCVKF